MASSAWTLTTNVAEQNEIPGFWFQTGSALADEVIYEVTNRWKTKFYILPPFLSVSLPPPL